METNDQEVFAPNTETVDETAPSETAPAVEDAPNPFETLETEEAKNKPASVPISRFNEVYAASKEATRQLKAVQVEKEQLNEALEFVHSVYGVYEMPIETMKHDATFMDVMDNHLEDPVIAAAVEKVKKLMRGEQPLPTVKRPETSQEDDRVMRILERDVRTRANAMLEKSKIDPTLRMDFVEHVIDNTDFSQDVEDADILGLLKDYHSKQGQKGSASATQNKSAPVSRPRIEADAPAANPESDKLATSEDWSERNRRRAAALLKQMERQQAE